MEPGEEPEPGSSSQNQNLHDLQSYLVTFNKDIGSGDDVLHNMDDVDAGVGDVSDLYGTASENPLQESGDAGVSESQFSSGFYSEQGMLGTTLSDEPSHPIQDLVGPTSTDVDSEMSEIKQEVNSMNLEGVTAQIAGFEDAHLTHAISGIQAGSLSQGLIMAPLGDSVMTNQGKVLSIVSLGGEEGQFLSLADGQQMQIINSEDLGLTTDGLDTGEGSLDISSTSSMLRSSSADSPIPLPALPTSAGGEIAHTSGISMVPGHSNGNLVTTATSATATSAGAATLLNPGLGQLVSLQAAGEGTQPQLVSLQGEAIQGDALQMQGLIGGEAVNGDLAYQTITIMPSDLAQNGDMNYVLILSQPEGEKESAVASMAQVYDLKQENQNFTDEMVDENGDVKRVMRFMPKKMVTQLGNQQLMCAFCNYTSPKRYLLTRHMRSHSDERPFKCESCDRGFKTSASLLNHVNTHTGTRPHKCKTCEAAFTTSGELVRHIRYRHTFEKPHRCPECDYASVELSKLKRHMRSHTGERPYKCPNCPYASPDTYKLKRHMRIHTGEKPYECDHCHARFTQSNSLKAHKLIHTGNKPVYQCSLCPTTCGRKTDLKIHFNKLHSAGMPLECRKCGKTYSDRYSYKQHLRTHDIEKCYKGEHFNFLAANEKGLDSHTMIHDWKHRCDECNTTFSSQKQFDKHLALIHPYGLARKKLDGDDKDSQGTLDSSSSHSIREGQQSGQAEESGGGGSGGCPVVITPLASHTLHRNLMQDMKEGKLGDVPQVVIVHPDGSQEEISSKLASGRWSAQEVVPSLSLTCDNIPSTPRTESTASNGSEGPETPAVEVAVTGNSMMSAADGGAVLVIANKEGTPTNPACAEDDPQSQSESSQHCEAATQVEIESDADSSSDATSLDGALSGKGGKEDPTQRLAKELQENIGSLVGLDMSGGRSSSAISDLSRVQVLKAPTSSSSLYVKTLINTSSGKKSITSLAASAQTPQSFPSVVKVTQTSAKPHISAGGSRTHQYSLLSSGITCLNSNDKSSSVKTSSSSSSSSSSLHSPDGDKSSGTKVFVSLAGLCASDGSQPPMQLLAGDSNPGPSSSVFSEGSQNDSAQLLEVNEVQSTSDLSHEQAAADRDDGSGEKETSAVRGNQGSKDSKTTDTGDNNNSSSSSASTSSSSSSDQSAIQSLICQQLPLPSESDSSDPDLVNGQTGGLNALSTNPRISQLTFVPAKEQCLDSSTDKTCDVRGLDVTSDTDSAVEQQSASSPSKPTTTQDTSDPKDTSDLQTSSETNLCDSGSSESGNEPFSPCLVGGPSHPTPPREDVDSKIEENVHLVVPLEEPAGSCGNTDISEQSHKSLTSDAVDTVNAEDLQSFPVLKSKSPKGRLAKRRAEADQALVMTGKRQRKALVKVSL